MKFYCCLLACLCLFQLKVRADVTLGDYTNVDPSNMIEEFRQPLYLKRANTNFWKHFFRPSGSPQPTYRRKLLSLAGLRGKRVSENYAFRKSSRDSARLRQRFYNLL